MSSVTNMLFRLNGKKIFKINNILKRYMGSHINYHGTGLEQCVGNTPLLYLNGASKEAGCNIYGKAEFMNPGGSVKDRAALWMIKDAEKKGELIRGKQGTIVEGTAGNTGIGLALVASIFGYETIIIIPRTQTKEKKDTLKQAGAKLIEVDAVPHKNDNHYVKIAKRLSDNLKKSGKCILYANQWDNLSNQQSHIQGTGPEIWTQTKGKINAFSCAVGTGGTLTGVGKYMKLMNKDIKICLTDPYGACIYSYFKTGELTSEGSSISEGIGQGRITGQIADGFIPDECYQIDDISMMNALQNLQTQDGIMCGLSTGINIAGAIKVAKELGLDRNPDNIIVTILCDLAQRYVTKQFNVPFLKSQNLPIPSWYTDNDILLSEPVLKDALDNAYV